MKYAKQARRDFVRALVKFEAFKEEQLKPLKLSAEDSKIANERIDKFAEGLGFNIYCEEYILSMVDYVGSVLVDDTIPHKDDYLSLITLITAHYVKEHSDVISQDFKDISITILKTYEMSSLLNILKDMGE